MSTAVARRTTTTHIARPLKVLIPLIQQDLEHGDRAGMEYYAAAGSKLIEAQSQVAFGHWGAWVSKNFHLVLRQAQLYMRLARVKEETQKRAGDSQMPRSLNEFRGESERARERRDRDRPFRDVLQAVDPDVYHQEKQTRDEEIRLHRELAIELVDLGFKALASRLHPDRRGPNDAMARLNRVRQELKGIAETRRFI